MSVRLVSDRKGAAPDTKKRGAPNHLSLVPQRMPEPTPRWVLESHVCRCCFGRIVSRPISASDADHEYLCTNCGARAESADPSSICSCGIKIRKRNAPGRSGGAMIDARIRCMANPSPSPEFPSLIVASEIPAATAVSSSQSA